MKLTQRDKIVLSVLVILLSLFCGVWFIIRPAFTTVQNSKKEYNNLRSEYQQKQQQLQEKESLVVDVKERYQESLDLANQFYDRDPSFDFAEDIYNLLAGCGISGTSATISESAKNLLSYSFKDGSSFSIPLDAYISTNDIATDDEQIVFSVAPNQTVGCYSFTVGFDHMTKENIFEFVEKLRKSSENTDPNSHLNKKTLIVTNLSFNLTEAEQETGYSGEVSLELYYMKKPDAPDVPN